MTHTSEIVWIPAHPCYGAVSMRRYWQALEEARREDDRYQVSSVIRPEDIETPSGFRGKLTRYWQRNHAYPALIRKRGAGRISHVLDHSWADMLTHLPKTTARVVTVHDLIPLRFPGSLSPAQLARFGKWVSHIRSADAIISVSQYTKEELVDLLGISPEKISVVPNGADLQTINVDCAPLRGLENTGDNFLIGSIGSTLERKNLSILPEALARLKATVGRKVRLVRAGARLPQHLADELKQVLGEHGLIELGSLSDEEVSRFYRSIHVMAIPSFYEGFGLPVLEAMAARVPVVSSNATSLPEVGGDLATYFDPNSAGELAAILAELALNPAPEARIEAAFQRASSFSWRRSLEGVFSVYDSLLGEKNFR